MARKPVSSAKKQPATAAAGGTQSGNQAHGNTAVSPYRQGIIVFAVLMILTIIEAILGLDTFEGRFTIPLVLIIILKAGIIVYYFMHIYRLWHTEGHH